MDYFKIYNPANNEFYEYLITPTGLNGPYVLPRGALTNNNGYNMVFSAAGDLMAGIDYLGLIQLFSFDRCTGEIALLQTISPQQSAPFPALWGCAFSPSSRYLYISSSADTSYLYQLDLINPFPWSNRITLWTFGDFAAAGGALKLAPDKKIYFSCAWNDGLNFNYPYPDSVFNMYNNNLSVINYPDSPGVACDFQPFSFNLGAGRTYWGLPNNPDYELGPDTNSICDTILLVSNEQFRTEINGSLHVFFHGLWQTAFINAEHLKGRQYNLQVFDLMGRRIYNETGKLNSEYFTKDLKCENFANGMYVVHLETNAEVMSQKFVKE